MERLELTIPSPTSKTYSQVPVDSPASIGASSARRAAATAVEADDGDATPSPATTPRQPCIPLPSPSRQKRWQVLPGRNKFFCDGRLMMSRSTGMFFLTIGLLFTVNGLFFALDCPYLIEKVSPVVPAVAAVLFFFVLANLSRAAFSDPGVIPRATKEEADALEREISATADASSTRQPRVREVVIRGVTVRLKYCFTCKIFRPPRASHCGMCDNCVEGFDHHCPWVGNCIGKRNYRYFYFFLFFLVCLCVFIFSCGVVTLVTLSRELGIGAAMKESPATCLELFVCFFSIWSVLGLYGYHSYLIAMNLTTNEDLKKSYSSRRCAKNPHARPSFLMNCAAALCGPKFPSLVRPRERITAEEEAALTTTTTTAKGPEAC